MERPQDALAVQRCVGAVPRTQNYTSNLYAAVDQIEHWCAVGKLQAWAGGGAVLMLLGDRDFDRLFHVAQDQTALGEALSNLPAGIQVTDLIGRGEALDAACATYMANGFVPHNVLQRMVRLQVPDQNGREQPEQVVVAAAADAPAVACFLERLLDPLAERIPDTAELAREAEAGRLLLVRRGAAIAGMLLYALRGQGAELRFWHVDVEARGQGTGSLLMHAFLARCASARRLVLWVVGDNHRSIAIYRYYGFEPDGLIDRIMVRRKEQQT